jgi:SAM-dependent methyltransferase
MIGFPRQSAVKTGADGLPVVPRALIHYTNGHRDLSRYHQSGREIAQMFDLAVQGTVGQALADFKRVLDFGCGTGRIAQFVKDQVGQLSACDVNARCIDFVQRAFPDVAAHRTAHAPPLPYDTGHFDLVYSFSVFSHLTQTAEDAWLAELARITRPGGVVLLTVHGDWVIEATLPAEMQHHVRTAGFYYRPVHRRVLPWLVFPDGYECSYHTSDYIRAHWPAAGFEVVKIYKGKCPHDYLLPGTAFAPEGAVTWFEPMGQDLVVLRRI